MKNPKTKTHTFWCVVTNDGIPLLFTCASENKISIEKYNDKSSPYPYSIMKSESGYTCQKFTITTKIK